MSEEEKEAIECLEMVLDNETDIETEDLTNKCINSILNLIKKQQKEIKELKEKERYWKRNAIPTSTINILYISKDKIKELIKEKAKTDTYNFITIAVKDIEKLLGE